MHYGWVIVLCGFLLTMFMMLETTTWSYFQVPICEDLGISYVQFSLTSTCSTIANMIFGLVLASKITKGNLRL